MVRNSLENTSTESPDSFDGSEDESYGARLIINMEALVENWQAMRALSAPARCAAVIKADGYGLGSNPVSAALYQAGCRDFFVATAREGTEARMQAPDARIFVMNCILPGIEAQCRNADLVPVLASMEHIARWTSLCIANGDHPCALQVDTGMNRLGITLDEALILANDVTRPAGFSPVLVMSHLACGDQPDHPLNEQQLERFQTVAAAFPDVESSLCNSAGIRLGKDYLFDLTRPGISLYGGSTGHGASRSTRPVVTAEARIIDIRQARKGETVSYGAAERLERDSTIAVCSIGYADGYLRSLSGAGVPMRGVHDSGACGFAKGMRLPVLGCVTMDLTAFDITDLSPGSLVPGDFIELFGRHINIDDVAAAGGTIGYEMLTAMGKRYQRFYVNNMREDMS